MLQFHPDSPPIPSRTTKTVPATSPAMSNEWKFFVPVVLALIALAAITIRQNQRIASLERRLEVKVAAEAAYTPGTELTRRDPPGHVEK